MIDFNIRRVNDNAVLSDVQFLKSDVGTKMLRISIHFLSMKMVTFGAKMQF